MMKSRLPLLLSILVLTMSPVAIAAKLKTGKDIATHIEKKNQGFGSEKSNIELIIEDSNKNKVSRKMNSKRLELDKDKSRSLIEFVKPSDVKGTKLLTWSFRAEDDSQWLYLKSMRRSKRITSSSRHSSFMGSEFTYDDFSTNYTDKSDYKLVKENKKFWWLRRTDKSGDSNLVREMKVSKKMSQAVEVKYFKANNTLQKQGVFSGFKKFKVKGKELYRATKIKMSNVITGKSSTMIISDLKMGGALKAKEFKKESLRE